MPPLLTVKQITERLCVTHPHALSLIHRAKLRAFNIGALGPLYRVAVDALDEFLGLPAPVSQEETTNMPEFMTALQVAHRLNVSYAHVLELIHRGKLRAVNVGAKGSAYRVTEEALAEFLRAAACSGPEPVRPPRLPLSAYISK